MRDIAFRELKNLQAYQLAVKNLTERIRIINDSMAVLSEEERNILFLYATESIKDAIHTIRDLYGYDQAQAYKIRTKALDKLTIAMFGSVKGGETTPAPVDFAIPAATAQKSATKETGLICERAGIQNKINI